MENINGLRFFSRGQLEHNLKEEFVATLDERISRYQELDFIKIVPATHFASVSSECIHLYRDGYFLACIALCQSVAEAIVRLMCNRNCFNSVADDFLKNIGLLKRRNIEPDCDDMFRDIWTGRNDYHHLNNSIPGERQKLQAIALSKLRLLNGIDAKVFAFEWAESGGISPKYSKYWDVQNGKVPVYLRFEP